MDIMSCNMYPWEAEGDTIILLCHDIKTFICLENKDTFVSDVILWAS
jgi:hypothetical protein